MPDLSYRADQCQWGQKDLYFYSETSSETTCAAIASADKSSLKLMESISSSTNVIARSAEGRAARCPMPPQSFRTESFGGFVALSPFLRGRKNQGSALTSVPFAALPYPIRLGICLASGFLPGCLRVTTSWKSLPICAWLPKPHGIPHPFKEHAMTSCQLFPSSSRSCMRMPNKRRRTSA